MRERWMAESQAVVRGFTEDLTEFAIQLAVNRLPEEVANSDQAGGASAALLVAGALKIVGLAADTARKFEGEQAARKMLTAFMRDMAQGMESNGYGRMKLKIEWEGDDA